MDNDSKKIVKPERPPDHVTSYGSAYWWPEMIYMSGATSRLYKIQIDQDDGSFCVDVNGNGQRMRMSDNIKKSYDDWWYETFESKLTDND